MNNILKYIISLGVGYILLPLAFSADNEKLISDETIRLKGLQVVSEFTLPSPTKQSIPRIGKGLVGTTVVFKFSVDKSGRIQHIRTAKALPAIYYPRARDFAVQMMDSLKHWEFAPALNANGQSVGVDILMPIKVVKKNGNTLALASMKLDTTTFEKGS